MCPVSSIIKKQMTNLNEMIKEKRVKLSKAETFWHYSIVPFLLIVPLITTWSLIQYYLLDTYTGVREPNELVAGYYFVIPAFIMLFIQRNRLKFKVLMVRGVSQEMFDEAIEMTSEALGWQIETFSKNYIRAYRPWSWSGSWGELITIIRDRDKILVNSICNPNAIFMSIASYGWNKKNVRTFINNLKAVNEK